MSKRNDRKTEKIYDTYYEYFTDYLIFSEQYTKLLEEGKLDKELGYGYPYFFANFVDDIYEENNYPKRIIENFLDFSRKMKQHLCKIFPGVEKESIDQLLEESIKKLEEVLQSQEADQTEIYLDEYDKRYSNMDDFHTIRGISVAQLEHDIQEDFLYYDALVVNTNISAKEISQYENLYPFLQKLIVEVPEVLDDPYTREKLLEALQLRNDEKAKEWFHFLKDKTKYACSFGFTSTSVEYLYHFYFLKHFLLQNGDIRILESVPIERLYTDTFIQSFAEMFKTFTDERKICKQEVQALYILASYLREHLKEYNPTYQTEIRDILNKSIEYLNTCTPEEESTAMYGEEIAKRHLGILKWHLASKTKLEEMKEETNQTVELCFQIFTYFLASEQEKELLKQKIEASKVSIPKVVNYIFSDYPRMFFDKTIYERTMTLLENKPFAQKVKRKISKISMPNYKKEFRRD